PGDDRRRARARRLRPQSFGPLPDVSTILRGRPLFERLQAGIDAAAAAGRPLGLLLLSIEGLGRFGILHGHLRAEALVELVRLRAQAVMRPDDTVLRLGPGEFLILLNSL